MAKPRVYALADSESVAETLAILLEPDCELRSLSGTASEAHEHQLPRPALLIDARRRRRAQDALAPLEWWPGLRVVRLDLLGRQDPTTARRVVSEALWPAHATVRLTEAIQLMGNALHAEVKPRLVATRCLAGMASAGAASTHPAWCSLLREQLLALGECLERLPIGDVGQ